MRAVRSLPPFLQALWLLWWLLGLLASIAAFGVLTWTFLAPHGDDPSFVILGKVINWTNWLLSLSLNLMLVAYSARFERPGRPMPSPASPKAQATAILAFGALLLCSLFLALLASPSSSLFDVVFVLQMLSALMLLVGYIWVLVHYHL
jgi:hypothetical protein